MVQGKVQVVPDDGLTTRARRNRPLIVVHCGDGKGKSTGAFGLALRGWNQGWSIGVFQFVKSAKWRIGEQTALEALDKVHTETGQGGPIEWHKMGAGWSWSRKEGTESEHADAAREGIHSFLAAPLRTADITLGALNLYGRAPAAFDALDADVLDVLTTATARAIGDYARFKSASEVSIALREAIEHRAPIEQAKGMLMALHRIDADAAFALVASGAGGRQHAAGGLAPGDADLLDDGRMRHVAGFATLQAVEILFPIGPDAIWRHKVLLVQPFDISGIGPELRGLGKLFQ